MKAKKWILITSVCLTILSLLCIFTLEQETRLYDVATAIFGGSILAVLISCIEYNIERRRAMEAFYCEAKKALFIINSIKYYDCKESTRIIAEFIKETPLDRTFDLGCKETGIYLPCTLRSCSMMIPSSGTYLLEYVDGVVDHPDINECYKHTVQYHKQILIDTVESWMCLYLYHHSLLGRLFANLDFIFNNKAIKTEFFQSIVEQVQTAHDGASTLRHYYNKSKELNSYYMCHDQLLKHNNRILFSHIEEDDWLVGYNKVADTMRDGMNKLHDMCYGKKPKKTESQPISYTWTK